MRDQQEGHREQQGSDAGQDEPQPAPELPPLELNLTRHVAIGTGLWALTLVVLLALHDPLESAGRWWWAGTAGFGMLIGLAGLGYLRATGGRGPR